MPNRPRGAQPGNTNALKHGFYSQQFSQIKLTDLEIALGEGLGDEIALMRVLIRRFVEVIEAESEPDLPLDDTSKFLNTLGSNMTRLAGLLRADKLLSGSEEIIEIAFHFERSIEQNEDMTIILFIGLEIW